ncbi:MAG TPA: zinc ribbon domain-containing protein YjdM [Microbacteriaceae bacterium]|nr:zinc ribbon domain-containing protein YjdM [Microbacteriaceae bacterium]
MSDNLDPCPKCESPYTYEMGALLVCPECAHEWSPTDESSVPTVQETLVRDAVGNILQDGDSVTITKSLKVKGATGPLKIGTRVKNIRLIEDSGDGHDIDCKIDGFGSMKLKSSIVKKV